LVSGGKKYFKSSKNHWENDVEYTHLSAAGRMRKAQKHEGEFPMKRLLLAAAAAGITLVAAVPASAQVYLGGGPSPGGVDVAPVGPGVEQSYGARDQWRGDYSDIGSCRLVRDRTVTPGGRVVFRTHRDCF
jgi:hypothetical protein